MRFSRQHDGRRDRRAVEPNASSKAIRSIFPERREAVVYERFVPTVDRQSGMPTADPRVNNPAVVLGVAQSGQPARRRRSSPAARWIDARRRLARRPAAYVLYSGFQYRYDPGVPLVGHRRLRPARRLDRFVLLSAGAPLRARRSSLTPERVRVGVAATTVKGYDVFESEFERLVVALKRRRKMQHAAR